MLKELAIILEKKGLKQESKSVLSLLKKIAMDTYTVKSGDTLYGISNGDPLYQKMIEDANKGVDLTRLNIGQEIVLPEKPIRPNESKNVSESLVQFIKKYEGKPDLENQGAPFLKAYDDGFGNATIGWGHNLGKLNPRNVKPISLEKAEQYLKQDIEVAAGFVRRNVAYPLTDYQFDALTSLVFNAGPNAVYKTKLFKEINKGNIKEAIALFPTTLIGANQGGLQLRRNQETAMFAGGLGHF